MMPPSRLDCPLSLETAHMGNPGLDVSGWVGVLVGVELGYEFGGSWGLFPQSTSMTQIAMPKARNTPNDEASRACVNSRTSVSGSS